MSFVPDSIQDKLHLLIFLCELDLFIALTYIDEHADDFYQLTEQLNQKLEGESLPAEPEVRGEIVTILTGIRQLLAGLNLEADTIEAVFRVKAYPEVLALYLEQVAGRE